MTIAISVLISAFNALTLSPALSAILLRPKQESRDVLARFFGWFNRVFTRSTDGYVSWSRALIRKAGLAMLVLVGFAVLDGLVGWRLPTGFLPEEDYGYAFLNVQLPAAASLERTELVLKKVEQILEKTEGVQAYNTIGGFSLLTRTSASYQGFFFIGLEPWHERTSEQLEAKAIVATLNRALTADVPEAIAIAFMPPSIPGLGSAGGFSFWLQDRSGGSVEFLAENLQKFLEACSKRAELAGVASQFSASVPQVYVEVDRDKVLKQDVAVGDVYQTLQAYLGGLFLNQFNRFGRQWRVFLQAEGEGRQTEQDIESYYVRNRNGKMVPLSALVATRSISGPEYTNRFNLYRAAQVIGGPAPGYSSGQAMAALEEVAAYVLPPEIGYEWADLSYQEQRASGSAMTSFALSLVFVFLILAALYESWSLPFSILLTVPVAVFGAFIGLVAAGLRSRRVCADRSNRADRFGGEERDPHRRVRQDRIGERPGSRGCSARGSAPAVTPNSDDLVRVHFGLRAVVDRDGLRRRGAAGTRHGCDRGHVGRNDPGHFSHPGDLLCGGAADRKTQRNKAWQPGARTRSRRRQQIKRSRTNKTHEEAMDYCCADRQPPDGL